MKIDFDEFYMKLEEYENLIKYFDRFTDNLPIKYSYLCNEITSTINDGFPTDDDLYFIRELVGMLVSDELFEKIKDK